jgi:hypothetical protein
VSPLPVQREGGEIAKVLEGDEGEAAGQRGDGSLRMAPSVRWIGPGVLLVPVEEAIPVAINAHAMP